MIEVVHNVQIYHFKKFKHFWILERWQIWITRFVQFLHNWKSCAPNRARPTAQCSPTPIWARGHQAVYIGPWLRVPSRARRRHGGIVGRPPPRASAVDQPTTSTPRAALAAAASTCGVCRVFIPCIAATPGPSSTSFPLRSPLLLCCRSISPSPPFPTTHHRPNRGTRPPLSPPRVGLRSSSRRGPSAPELSRHRPPLPPLRQQSSTAASSAPPSPSTPPVASPEL
jgi:hypothetical protein